MCFNWLFQLKVEIFLYSKGRIDRELAALEPLSGCFDPARIPSEYNTTKVWGPKKTEVHAGLSMKIGLDCYDLAGTIPSEPRPSSSERINYHSYWRSDLATFGERQEWFLKSFFATQDTAHSKLILWSNGNLRPNKYLEKWLQRFPESFELRIANIPTLAKGTALEGSRYLSRQDPLAWVDGDLVRLLVVWNFGGVWVDMDSLLTRDIYPLLEHEFFTQWDCYGEPIVLYLLLPNIQHWIQTRNTPPLMEHFSTSTKDLPIYAKLSI
jgi:hypothetical protein